MTTKHVVFVHGMFMTPLCWQHWVERFSREGLTCIAPAWPGRDASIEELRAAHPDARLGRLGFGDVVEHFTSRILALKEKPAIVGHSMGGLVVQILLARGLATAGVAIDSAPPVGVSSFKWSFLKSNWTMINPFRSKDAPHMMTFEQFQYAFVNTLPAEEQKAAYERYVVPESRRVPRDSLGEVGQVDFTVQRPPLLLVAGAEDHIIPAALNRANYERWRKSSATTDFHEFAGRDHFLIGSKGWEEIADHSLAWLRDKGSLAAK
jgi:alpha-beta hydrolase superfamily lysophospholipase